MTTEDVVLVEMTPLEIQALLAPERKIDTSEDWGALWDRAERKLRAALDAPPVERVEEWRIIGERGVFLDAEEAARMTPEALRECADEYRQRHPDTGVRIQVSTVTRTQWRDLEEGSADDHA